MIAMLQNLSNLKKALQILAKEYREKLAEDPDYVDLKQCVSDAREPLLAHVKRLGDTIPAIGSIKARIEAKRTELKTLKAAIVDGLRVVSKDTGEELQMKLTF